MSSIDPAYPVHRLLALVVGYLQGSGRLQGEPYMDGSNNQKELGMIA